MCDESPKACDHEKSPENTSVFRTMVVTIIMSFSFLSGIFGALTIVMGNKDFIYFSILFFGITVLLYSCCYKWFNKRC